MSIDLELTADFNIIATVSPSSNQSIIHCGIKNGSYSVVSEDDIA